MRSTVAEPWSNEPRPRVHGARDGPIGRCQFGFGERAAVPTEISIARR